MKKISLTIDKCPLHGVYAISLDDEGASVRLTPDKCCGRWERHKAWPISARAMREMAEELECQADQMEQE